ncbi:MAG TPA: alanine--tRNA ligase, partial [Actinomycetota bacterium]|nr:alanine--tRNA ligase [Actinomycetota bacterium]
PLPAQNIDTGSSLERVAMVLQDVDNVFLTDLLRPLLAAAERVTDHPYGRDERTDVSLRVIAEHGRATTFLIGDGVLPSNEGRGYVLRRMLRRVVTHARRLGVDRPVLGELVQTTVALMGEAYPELTANQAFILQVASSEEERFAGTYRQGIVLLEQEVGKAKETGTDSLPGSTAFRLHDTHGFPLEITLELASEEGLAVDTDAFASLMEDQRRRAQQAAKKGDAAEGVLGQIAAQAGPTEFVGYELLNADGRLVGLAVDGTKAEAAGEGLAVRVVLDRTSFYAEGGGQVGDAGIIQTADAVIEVTDTQPGPGGTIVHHGRVAQGEVKQGQEMEAVVDGDRRVATARSHTATHVVHHEIRSFLGEHARQAGSLVKPGELRFDFTHFEPVPRGSLEEIEYLVNRHLGDDQPVRAYETTIEFARSQGAIALFGEKYGDIVRVVEVGDYSVELCGGTHVRHTGEVALVRLLHEASIGSGFRRIEALTGLDALKHINAERRLLEEVMEAVGAGDPKTAPERVRHAVARVKQLESELGKLRREEQRGEVDRLAGSAEDVDGAKMLVQVRPGANPGELRELAIKLRDKLAAAPVAVVLVGTDGGKTSVVGALTAPLVSRGLTAADVVQPLATAAGGKAGGKPELAMGGGPHPIPPDEAAMVVRQRLHELLGG